MTKFEVGKLYALTFNCGDGRYPCECVKRTDKTVTIRNHSEIKRYKIKINSTHGELIEYVRYCAGGYIEAELTNNFCMCTN